MIHFNTYTGFLFAQETSSGGSTLAVFLPLLIMGGLFYFLLILPRRRQLKKMDQMRSSISIGDEVRTVGGIIGTVISDDDDEEFTIDIGGQSMRILKRAIAGKHGSDDE